LTESNLTPLNGSVPKNGRIWLKSLPMAGHRSPLF